MSKPQPLPVRPEPEQPERLDPETERVLQERLTNPGPLRPWSEFEAEESRRKPQPPTPR
jgi:hypothetical protein